VDLPKPSFADDPGFLARLESLDDALPSEIYHGMSERPFSLSTDPKFFYHSAAHDRVAQDLLTAIRSREGIVVVSGAAGTGKTILCRAVMEQLDRRTLASFVGEPMASTEELLKTVLGDFGVVSPDDLASGPLARATRRELSTALRQFLTALAPLQAAAVIFIDSAQSLSADVLQHIRMLFDVVSKDRLLQVVLVGQPPLLEHIARQELHPLAQRITVSSRLEPLAGDEIGDYVSHRLTVAGGAGRVRFDEGGLARVYDFSRGIPRVINLLCDRALTLGHDSGTSVIGKDFVDRASHDLHIPLFQFAESAIEPEDQPGARPDVPLETSSPEPRFGAVPLVIAGLALLTFVGAPTAALVFRDRLSQIVTRWEAVPPLPGSPAPHIASPLHPLPLPGETLEHRPRVP
jgi:general secretion pathway protein A